MTPKPLARAVAVLALAALTAGCQDKKEMERLRSENAKLTQESTKLKGEVQTASTTSAEMEGTLDEVQKSLEELRLKELKVIRTSLQVLKEGKPATSKREQVHAEIDEIKKAIKENLDKLTRLEKEKQEAEARAAASGKQVKALEQKTSALERLVGELRRSLEEKESTIAELEVKVLELSRTTEELKATVEDRESTIVEKEKEVAKAFVLIGPKAAMKKAGLIEKKGAVLGMGGSWVRTGKFDESMFQQIDTREVTEFEVAAASTKARVLSDHPKDSFELTATGPKTSKLKVTDPARFWQGSHYLIIMLPE